MGLFDKLRKDSKATMESESSPKGSDQDQALSHIYRAGKLGTNGQLQKIDMKQISSQHIISIVKGYKSLDEQNKYL